MILTYSGRDSMLLEQPKDLFNYWVFEREEVRYKKERGDDKPWSTDPIFQTAYFTNVNREKDKTTKYIRAWAENIEVQWLPMWYTFARMINWPDALDEIDPTTSTIDEAIEVLKERRNRGDKIFSGAYLITTCGEKMDKLDYVGRVCNDVNRLVSIFTTLQCQWDQLVRVKGLGSFLAAQVIADLKNTKNTIWADADDWWSFVVPGPGSIKGMNYYMERKPLTKNIPLEQFKREIVDAKNYLRDQFNTNSIYLPRICNQDLQNCFCEFSKYMRILRMEGKSKRKYPGY